MAELVEVCPDPRIARLDEKVSRLTRERDDAERRAAAALAKVREYQGAVRDLSATLQATLTRLEFYQPLIDVAAEWAGETRREQRAVLAAQLYQLALAEVARRTEAS